MRDGGTSTNRTLSAYCATNVESFETNNGYVAPYDDEESSSSGNNLKMRLKERQIQKDGKLGPAFLRVRWPVEKFLNCNGHITMLELCQELDCLCALACRVLLGLARDDTIAHILTKLQTPGGEQGRWQKELSQVAIELMAVCESIIRSSYKLLAQMDYEGEDGCLIANEIVNYAKSEDSRLMLFKVDFEKAFDSVNWAFLHDIMQQMGFCVKWHKWVNMCMNSALISVLVNGSPSRKLKMERGLKQGDPLSPFLFLIAAKALQVLTLEVCNKGVYKGLSLAEDGANVSLL
ncbi:cysteine-rich receptor-like protein kinase [Tanacetum coccineum]